MEGFDIEVSETLALILYILQKLFRELWVSRDDEREQAAGPAERLRVRADLRGQGW
jgi:hypothetical protein